MIVLLNNKRPFLLSLFIVFWLIFLLSFSSSVLLLSLLLKMAICVNFLIHRKIHCLLKITNLAVKLDTIYRGVNFHNDYKFASKYDYVNSLDYLGK